MAAWHPHLVQHLVVLEAGVGGGAEDLPAQLGNWFAGWPVPFPSRQAAVEHLGGTPIAAAWEQDLQERDGGPWPRFDADVVQAAIAALAHTACRTESQQVQAPPLLVQAERSILDTAGIDRMLELRPSTGHVLVPDAGYDVHLDQPAAWTWLLRHHLGTTPTPPGPAGERLQIGGVGRPAAMMAP